jgi:hypothetical protein
MNLEYALSIRQPWAALLVHGLKTVEVRRWQTDRRGRVLIHAALTTDDRRAGWKLLSADMHKTAALRGGIIGVAELVDCVTYASADAFNAEQALHRNDSDWYEPGLYGFRFADARCLPFRKLAGYVRFFPVTADALADE